MITLKRIEEFIIIFGLGAIIYSLIEVVFRGYTHWTMTLTGGVVFILIYLFNMNTSISSLVTRCLIGSGIVTVIEFCVGCIVNRGLNLHVWDYSEQKLNLLGQICPLFSALWFVLCIPATFLSMLLSCRFRENNLTELTKNLSIF